MSGFFYEIVDNAVYRKDKEVMADLYDMKLLIHLETWCADQLESVSTPYDVACYIIRDLFDESSNFPSKFIQYIQDTCKQGPDEKEEEEEEVEQEVE
jgi:hypothetical protein